MAREGSVVGCVTRSRIDERGRIGIPRDMLEPLGLRNGDAVVLCFSDDHIILIPEDSAKRMIQKAISTDK
jgi:AbrB family looped-hinge helix DNA binding protein